MEVKGVKRDHTVVKDAKECCVLHHILWNGLYCCTHGSDALKRDS